MQFNKIFEELPFTSGTCLTQTIAISPDVQYVRALLPGHTQPEETDFQTLYELGKRPSSDNNSEICQYRGISLCKSNETNDHYIIAKLAQSRSISPKKFGENAVKFKLPPDCGLIQETPSRHNKWHCTFYKCDCFTVRKIIDPIIINI